MITLLQVLGGVMMLGAMAQAGLSKRLVGASGLEPLTPAV